MATQLRSSIQSQRSVHTQDDIQVQAQAIKSECILHPPHSRLGSPINRMSVQLRTLIGVLGYRFKPNLLTVRFSIEFQTLPHRPPALNKGCPLDGQLSDYAASAISTAVTQSRERKLTRRVCTEFTEDFYTRLTSNLRWHNYLTTIWLQGVPIPRQQLIRCNSSGKLI